MNETTQRPWHVSDDGWGGTNSIIFTNERTAVAYVEERDDDGNPLPYEANAALIVRAVNAHNALVEALDKALDVITGYQGVIQQFQLETNLALSHIPPVRETVKQGDAALALAKGEEDER